MKEPSHLSDGYSSSENEITERRLSASNIESCSSKWQNNMNVTNTGQGELYLYRGQNIGIVDLRSAGYYHIARDGIQRCLHERFIFLNEKDSQDYLSLIHISNVSNNKIPQNNIRLDIRKTLVHGTVKTPKCKDDAKNDPYPWLDDNDPRRHMTDKDLLESTIDLPESCITGKQK